MSKKEKRLPPIHPGEVLLEDFLKPMGLSVNAVATALGITATRLNDVARGRRGISADTALRLGKYFGMTAQFWMNLQSHYDLETAEDAAGEQIAKIKQREPGSDSDALLGPRSIRRASAW